jgi:hypothetical protein
MFESCRAHCRTTFAGSMRRRVREANGSCRRTSVRVAEIPDTIVLRRHRDLEGRRKDVWFRRGLLALVAAIPVLGLFNVFGQRPAGSAVATSAARLQVYAPTRLRGGLLYEARFRVTARHELKKAILVLDPGWAEGMSINTIEPSPSGEASRDGQLEFTLGHIPQGRSYLLFVQFQVNPTNVAWHRPQNVELDDGNTVVARIHRTITVFP